MVKTTLLGSGMTYHHDEIDHQVHKIIRQFGMVNKLEIENYFIHKVRGRAISLENAVPMIINKHQKGYVPDGRGEMSSIVRDPVEITVECVRSMWSTSVGKLRP